MLACFPFANQRKALEATAESVEACFREAAARVGGTICTTSTAVLSAQAGAKQRLDLQGQHERKVTSAAPTSEDNRERNVLEAPAAGKSVGVEAPIPSRQVFDDDVSWRLANAVIRSLRRFRVAAAGTEAAVVPGALRCTPAVRIRRDRSIDVDDEPRLVALAGLRLAGAVATAPGPARALLEAGVFHVLWRLPSDPAATPAGIALALGALSQGVRHAEVLKVFATRLEGNDSGASEAESTQPSGYEVCAAILSQQVCIISVFAE